MERYEPICRGVAAQRLIEFVPPTEFGWDSRPRQGAEILVKAGQILTDA